MDPMEGCQFLKWEKSFKSSIHKDLVVTTGPMKRGPSIPGKERDWQFTKGEEVQETTKGRIFLIKDFNSESFFDEMYDFETAKKVYFYFKKCFYLCGYDPFSFTKNGLTYDEKVSFLHDAV